MDHNLCMEFTFNEIIVDQKNCSKKVCSVHVENTCRTAEAKRMIKAYNKKKPNSQLVEILFEQAFIYILIQVRYLLVMGTSWAGSSWRIFSSARGLFLFSSKSIIGRNEPKFWFFKRKISFMLLNHSFQLPKTPFFLIWIHMKYHAIGYNRDTGRTLEIWL